MSEVTPTVDVAILLYRPKDGFPELLSMLKSQSHPVQKVILMVTTYPGQELPDFSAFPFIEIHYLSEKEFDHGTTRNMAASYAAADFLLFLTDDVVITDEDYIAKMVSGFTGEDIIASYSRQIPKKDCHYLEQISRHFNYPAISRLQSIGDVPEKGIKALFCSDVACMYRLSLFRELGGFTEPVIFNEDMIFAHKALTNHYRIFYNHQAAVYHSHNLTGKELYKRNFDLGVSQADHPEVFQNISSEKEGGGLIKYTIRVLWKAGRMYLLPKFIYQCVMKYLGYRAGKSYRSKSPDSIRRKTLNRHYWDTKE